MLCKKFFFISCVSLFVLLMFTCLSRIMGADSDNEYQKQIQRVHDLQLESDDLKEILLILESSISEAILATPYLHEEINNSTAKEISQILERVSNSRTQNYKITQLEVGLLELSQKLPMISFRNIAKDEKERKKASEQYASIQALIMEKTTEPLKEFDKLTANIMRDFLYPIFDNVQNDLFCMGYGNPLTTHEYNELSQMVVDAINESVRFSQRFKETGVPSTEIRNIAHILREYSKKISDFLQKRDCNDSSKMYATISKRVNKSSVLMLKLQKQLMSAEQEEIKSMIMNVREEGEKMIRENNPTVIEKQAESTDGSYNNDYTKDSSTYIIIKIFLMTIGFTLLIFAGFIKYMQTRKR